MDAVTLADRIRGVVKASTPRRVDDGSAGTPGAQDRCLDRVLGGVWTAEEGSRCLVVRRHVPGDVLFGRERVGGLSRRLAAASGAAPLLVPGAPSDRGFVFFDVETTGLSGGAGTYVFLAGFGSFDEDGFSTTQYVLSRYADEPALLAHAAREIEAGGVLVSFNGKSFDAPLLETRYLFHRMPWPGAGRPHLDALHPARRFWGESPASRWIARARDPGGEAARPACSLGSLERHLFDAQRVRDVPGSEIPGRYFHFVRSGDPDGLAGVLEHNRLDLLALAALTARLLQMVEGGPGQARHAREALALGRVYARAGLHEAARDAFARALRLCESSGEAGTSSGAAARVAALRALALAERRARRFDAAARAWRALLTVEGCPRHLAREASEALAIHHEHRLRDLPAAKLFALSSLQGATAPALRRAVQRRLLRIGEKLERRSRADGADAARPLDSGLLEFSLRP
jgi:uncharacterized protein YprB with RNaseH-like and TPR domain